jgi:hypothetical protein
MPSPATEFSEELHWYLQYWKLTKKTHWFGWSGRVYRATRKGRVHRSCAIATKDLSLTVSEMRVIPNIVIIPATKYGIASRFVLNVENLRESITRLNREPRKQTQGSAG